MTAASGGLRELPRCRAGGVLGGLGDDDVHGRHCRAARQSARAASTSGTRGSPATSASGDPARLVGRAVDLVRQLAGHDASLEDDPHGLERASAAVGALLGRTTKRVHAQQPDELDLVPGLLAHLADGRLGGRLVEVDAAAGQRPETLGLLVPQREKHPSLVVEEQGVGGEPGVVVAEVHGLRHGRRRSSDRGSRDGGSDAPRAG